MRALSTGKYDNCFQYVLGNKLWLHLVAYVNKYAVSTVVQNDSGSLNNGMEGKWFDTVGDQDCVGIYGSRPWGPDTIDMVLVMVLAWAHI
jgi:hypothetical protein